MKTTIYKSVIALIITLANLLVSASLFAQAPQKMSYQAVIRDGGDALVTSRPIGMRISILKNTTPVYVETHIALANANGLVTLEIGSGTLVSGNLAAIDWAAGAYFIKTETDPTGGRNYLITGASQLLSVPYALYANTAGNSSQGATGATSTASGDLTGTYPAPLIANNAITTAKIADGNVTDAKIATVSGSKVTGTVAVANGGTGAATAPLARTNLGLGSVDNTTDALKPVSTATQNALNTKAAISGQVFTGAISATNVRGTNTGDQDLSGLATTTALALKAPITSPTFTGTVSGITSAMVGLANVNNTTDALKPVSTAAQTALNLKLDANKVGAVNGAASLNAVGKIPSSQLSPITLVSADVIGSEGAMLALSSAIVGSIAIRTDESKNYVLASLPPSTRSNWLELLTPGAVVLSVNGQIGTVSLTKTDIILGNVDNTSDVNKPVSTATQTALNLKENTANKSTGTALGTSDVLYPTQNAVKTYVDVAVTGATITDAATTTKGKIQLAGDLSGTAASPIVPGLALKVDKETGKGLSANDYTTAEKTKVSNLSGTNTGDQDLSSFATTTALSLKAPVTSPTFTGTVSGITSAMVGLGSVDNTTDALKPVSTATQNALNLKLDANKVGAVNGAASLNAVGKIPSSQLPPIALSSADVIGSEVAMLALSSAIVGSIAIRTDESKNYVLASLPSSTRSNWLQLLTPGAVVLSVNGQIGTVSLTKTDIILGNVDNTSDVNKPVSSATQNALNLKETTANKSTGTALGTSDVLYPTQNAVKTYVDVAVTGTTIADAATTTKGKIQLAGDLSGTAAAPTVPGLALKVDKETGKGLSANDYTTAEKTKVSNLSGTNTGDQDLSRLATTIALDLKANTLSPTFTGTVSGITSAMVGLENVNNTSDATKNAATATLTNKTIGDNLNLNANKIINLSTPTASSDAATKAYVDAAVTSGSSGMISGASGGTGINNTDKTITLGGNLITSGAFATTLTSTAATNVTLPAGTKTLLATDGSAAELTLFPTLNQSTTGTASNVTGTVTVANGGTGATTKSVAFDALSPMTTAGDIIYGGTSGTGTRLAKGTDGQVLTLASGIPAWSNSGSFGVLTKSASYTILTTDNAKYLIFTGSTASQTITLPSAISVGAGMEITIKNVASVRLSIAATAGFLISDSTTTEATSVAIGIEPSNNWIKAISDGTNWYILRALF